MPLSGSQKALMKSLSGVERCGATRCGYTDARLYVSIGGVHYATAPANEKQRVMADTLTITEVLNETPNTAQVEMEGGAPTIGQKVIATVGSKNSFNRRFAGSILDVAQSSTKHRARFSLSLIDPTWRLDERLVSGHFTGSATAIAKALMHGWAPAGFTSKSVETNLPDVSGGITYTLVKLPAALTRLARRIGGYWYIDYHDDLHFFITGSESKEGPNPPDMDAASTTSERLLLGPIVIRQTASQLITRVYVGGYGTVALAGIAVGETRIPLLDAAVYFSPGGGMAKCGTNILTYTGILAGGTGTLVGPGVAPAAAPTLALASGAGVDDGVHRYAVTFGTAGGESLPSPLATITVGTVAAPSSAPTAGAPQSGSGPDPGAHQWCWTFTTALGETTPSGLSNTITTTGIAAPGSGLTATRFVDSGGVNPGAHDYAFTFVDSSGGETTPSPLTSVQSVVAVDDPAPFSGSLSSAAVGSVDPGGHQWGYTFRRTADGAETALTQITAPITVPAGNWTLKFTTAGFDATPAGCTLVLYRTKASAPLGTFFECTSASVVGANLEDAQSDASLGGAAPSASETANDEQAFTLTNILPGPPGTAKRNIYRTAADDGQLKLLYTLHNNVDTAHVDNADDSNLGSNAPAVSTAGVMRVLIALPTVPPGMGYTGVKIYRNPVGSAQQKLAHTITNTSTGSWLDTIPDSSLGANVPVVNTAGGNRVTVGIPLGGPSVTARYVYRTLAAGLQLRLVATVANNTDVSYTDSTADTALGANVPTSDTSGLTQPDGQVAAGATTLPCAGTGFADPAGGWAVIGNGQQCIRYTGVSGNDLTGIPASGNGAITAAVSFNSTVTAAPCLIGIPASGAGSVQVAITPGDKVNVFVQRDNVPAQTQLAAQIGGNGIREHYISDERLSIAECEKRGEALLALHGAVDVTAEWPTRHPSARAGRTQRVDLGAPTNTTADLKIQQVITTGFQLTLPPTSRVMASNKRFSFEDLINGESGA